MDTAASDPRYRAFQARDARFDGRFFIGVRSTGVYCRPVCVVRTPKAVNCLYFPSAAAAEAGGFRPCLRCRPELAPGWAPQEAGLRYADAAAALIGQGLLDRAGMAALAARLGIGERHLRRVFSERFGVSPIAWAQTQRLLLAKQWLSETALPMTEVAALAGFGSLRRFNALMRARYGMQPSELRERAQRQRATPEASPPLRLAYRPPLDWDWQLRWLAQRALPAMEQVDLPARRYRRTLSVPHAGTLRQGWIEVGPGDANALTLRCAPDLLPAWAEVRTRVRRLLDLDASPQDILAALGPLAQERPGLRLPGAVDGLEAGVRALLEQQVSTAAAATLLGRLVERWGASQPTPWPGLDRRFPDATTLAQVPLDALAALGLPRLRAQAVHALATAVAQGALDLETATDLPDGLARLQALPGVGPWTAGWIAMRAWHWPDVFLATDGALAQRLPGLSPAGREALAERWRPWRSYAVLHLWARQTPWPPDRNLPT
ncbi:DNA-3-methyladenine glycosylase 2 [Ideonella livida]|uniref:DNA-3-methyladenine glycosylase II n=1 Tax=Ideonella livida TaxID=2707176 RepID=A0A7C9TLF9_9BURK|nr:DNA-3-methyladenine glycosylase 2 [Ideonella livida]NDY90946.1 DNA-3-methyladenine glycosylase 2 [Ideonella livida]